MTDKQVFAALQWIVDNCESVPVVWRGLLYALVVFLAVTAVSVVNRQRLAALPIVLRLPLVFERPVLGLWRLAGRLCDWIAPVLPDDVLPRAAVEAAQKRTT